MTIADYHVHTAFSIDCKIPMEEQCRAAIEAGVTEIAFTEHVDHDECDAESRDLYDYEAYGAEIARCRELFSDRLTVLRAAEVDWNRSIEDDVLAFVDRASFDFIIGSVHNIDHTYVGFTTPDELGGPAAMYDRYYDEMLALVEAGFPSVVGHLDLPRRYHNMTPNTLKGVYERSSAWQPGMALASRSTPRASTGGRASRCRSRRCLAGSSKKAVKSSRLAQTRTGLTTLADISRRPTRCSRHSGSIGGCRLSMARCGRCRCSWTA